MEQLLTAKVLDMFMVKYYSLYSGLVKLTDSDLLPYTEKILSYYIHNVSSDLTKGVDSLAKISFDYIKYQIKFVKTKKYHQILASVIEQELYNSEKMEEYYLDGLFLSYALWPNHIKIYRYFVNQFLPQQKQDNGFLELGVGHGLMSLTILDKLPQSQYHGVDVSRFSIKFTSKLLATAGIEKNRFSLNIGNVANIDLTNDQSFLSGICCEVLEHVENPNLILSFFYRNLKDNAKLFVTTVINIAAEDHIYLFRNVDEIHQLFKRNNFLIESEEIFNLKTFSEDCYSANYAAILTKI